MTILRLHPPTTQQESPSEVNPALCPTDPAEAPEPIALVVHHGNFPASTRTSPRLASRLPRWRSRRSAPTGPIVVAVTSLATSHPALLYAATCAHRLGLELVVVHAWQQTAANSFEHSAAVVSDSVEFCRSLVPDVIVTGKLVQGEAAQVIATETRSAQLLVLAMPPAYGRHRARMTKLTRCVVNHSHCPVALARLADAPVSATSTPVVTPLRPATRVAESHWGPQPQMLG